MAAVLADRLAWCMTQVGWNAPDDRTQAGHTIPVRRTAPFSGSLPVEPNT